MTVFPNGKHDDQVGSTAQFLDWFKRPFLGQNAYELMRMLAEEAEPAPQRQTERRPTRPSPRLRRV